MKRLKELLGRPRIIEQQIPNRKISWLELFFDLMFAVVISRLTDSLVANLTLKGFFNATLLFGWFIWGWNELSGYFDNHGNDSPLNILIINSEMVLTGIGTIFIPVAVNGDFRQIAIPLMAIEALMAGTWFILAYFDRVHGPASRVWGIVHLVSLAVMVAGFLARGRWLVLSLVVALLFNILDVVVANPRLAREYDRAEMAHQLNDSLIERYGLMTMIALGEIIAGMYETFNEGHIARQAIDHFVLALVVVALVAAIYYQVLGNLHIVLNSSIETIMTGWLFILVVAFVFYLGVAFQLVLTAGQVSGRVGLALSLILFLVAIRMIVFIGEQGLRKRNSRIINGLLVLESVGLMALALTPTPILLGGTAIILLVIIAQGKVFGPVE